MKIFISCLLVIARNLRIIVLIIVMVLGVISQVKEFLLPVMVDVLLGSVGVQEITIWIGVMKKIN